MNYNIQLSINDIDYTNYLQIPLIVQYTADETLDIASFSLNFLTQKTPFKPYSIVDILIEQEGNIPTGDIMLLESDNVTEFQCNGGLRYRHDIKCVELTQLLSTYILPDITITQPITAFAFPNAVPSVTETNYTPYMILYDNIITFTFFCTDTTFNIKSKYTYPLGINVPIYRKWIVYKTVYGPQYSRQTTIFDSGTFTYDYYYKLHSASTWTAISDITAWSPEVGNYDLKAQIKTITYNYQIVLPYGTAENAIPATSTLNTNQTLIFNIEVLTTTGDEYIYSIKEGIDKVIQSYFLEEVSETTETITLDSDLAIRMNLDSIKCPEMTITNGKNMFEVLASIGKEFSGIPRLIINNENNKILTFDILSDPADNPNYNDNNGSLETRESNSTNYASGLVAEVSNMTSAEYIKDYPGNGKFSSVRCDPSENALMETNMCMLVDDGINRLHSVIVTNWNTSDLNEEVDITDYIKEKTLYDALNNSATGKGLALYYVRGTNKIVGLGFLPNIQNLLNLESGDYIIKRIIENKAVKTASADVKSYMYNIQYVPYTHGREEIIQSNLADFDKLHFAAYNQETANINSELFGQSAQKALQRLGNIDITKTSYIYNISQIPLLGEKKETDDGTYYANVINVEYNNKHIKLSMQYTKDYNKINNRVGIDKEYREYSLYANNYVDRTISIKDYCIVEYAEEKTVPTVTSSSLYWLASQYSRLYYSYGANPASPYDCFWITPYKTDATTRLTYMSYESETETTVPKTGITTSYNVLGNAIRYFGWTYDNFSVGQYIDGDFSTSVWGKAANKDARYVDDVGECPILGVELSRAGAYSTYDIDGGKLFPIANTDNVFVPLWSERKFKINKDNRERIGIRYSSNTVTYQKPFNIHSSSNKYVFKPNKFNQEALGTVVFVGYQGNIKQKNILKYTAEDVLKGAVTRDATLNDSYFWVVHTPDNDNKPTKSYNGFALVFSGTGEILYSYEQPITAGAIQPTRYIRHNFVKSLD